MSWLGCCLSGRSLAVVLAYVFTEYLLTRFDVRRRVLVGDGSPLLPILVVNGVSFLVVCISSVIVVFATDVDLYAYAALICLCAQGVWLSQHLWFYYRDHLRLRYE